MKTHTTIDDDGMVNKFLGEDLHCDTGPAVYHPTNPDKWKRWYRHGVLHNASGPAIIKADGTKRWFFDGIELSEDEFTLGLMKFDAAMFGIVEAS